MGLGRDVRTFVEERVALVFLEGVADEVVLGFCPFGLGMDRGEFGLFGIEGDERRYC